jgi:hypothetical protein
VAVVLSIVSAAVTMKKNVVGTVAIMNAGVHAIYLSY